MQNGFMDEVAVIIVQILFIHEWFCDIYFKMLYCNKSFAIHIWLIIHNLV